LIICEKVYQRLKGHGGRGGTIFKNSWTFEKAKCTLHHLREKKKKKKILRKKGSIGIKSDERKRLRQEQRKLSHCVGGR